MQATQSHHGAGRRVGIVVVAGVSAVAAIFAHGEVEVALVLVATVLCSLTCFEAALDRQRDLVVPWLLLSVAPLGKTVAVVFSELQADAADLAPHDELGTVVFALAVLGAVVAMARPAAVLGQAVATYDAAIAVGVALAVCLAGTMDTFVADGGGASGGDGSLTRSYGWFAVGGLAAACAIAASHPRRISPTRAAFLSFAVVIGAVSSASVLGAAVPRDVWAVVYLLVTALAAFGGALGTRRERDRFSLVVPSVAIATAGAAPALAAVVYDDVDVRRVAWTLLTLTCVVLLLVAGRYVAAIRRPVIGRGRLGEAADGARAAARASDTATRASDTAASH